MMGFVHDAVMKRIIAKSQAHEAAWRERHPEGQTHLSVSDLGWCIRKAYLPLHGYEPTHPFDHQTEMVMDSGNVWENETALALEQQIGKSFVYSPNDAATAMAGRDISVRDGKWSGRIDFLLPSDVIVEHKNTANNNFLRGRLPYASHCLQVLMYKYLYEKIVSGRTFKTVLYYRGRGMWAELNVWETDEGIVWNGEIQGKTPEEKTGLIKDVSLYDSVAEFEMWWGHYEPPPIPYESPFSEGFACTKWRDKRQYPACRYLGVCWPSLADLDGPFSKKLWVDGEYLPSAGIR